MLLNFTYPSRRRILQGVTGPGDSAQEDEGGAVPTRLIEGIRMVLGLQGSDGEVRILPESGSAEDVPLFSWPVWDEPTWRARKRPMPEPPTFVVT